MYYYTKHHISYLSLLSFILLLSCKYNTHTSGINDAEYHIDNKLASISKDSLGNVWIGSETGDIYNYYEGIINHYDLNEDLIYRASQHITKSNDTLLWVAVRNSGLQVWNIKIKEKPIKVKTYNIEYKNDRYSPYDFIFTNNNNVIVSTSLGLYKINLNDTTSRMSLIYPTKDQLNQQNGHIYIFRNLCLYQDSLVLGATYSGINIYNIYTDELTSNLENINIEHVNNNKDTIYALSQDYLYKILPSNLILKNAVYNKPKMLYTDANNNSFLVGSDNLMITKDFKKFQDVKINRNIPTKTNVHNLMIEDTDKDFSLLITENALWRIASNINTVGAKKIRASFVDNNANIYYLSNMNELYLKTKDNDEANWIFSFYEDDPIIWMDKKDQDLFLLSASNTFYRINVSDKWYRNLLEVPKRIFNTPSKVTKLYICNCRKHKTCFIGTQEGLFYLSEDSVRSLPSFEGMYITSIFEVNNTDRLYVSTLNDGIFISDHEHKSFKKISDFSDVSFIKDIIATNDHQASITILTNQFIAYENLSKKIKTKGINNLLFLNDTVFFAIPQHGIEEYNIRKESITLASTHFKDMKFNPNACLISDNKLILGSDIGSISVDVDDLDNYVWTTFGDMINMKSVSIIFIVTLLGLITISVIVRMYLSEKKKINNAQLLKMQEELFRRINDVEVFINQPYSYNKSIRDTIQIIKQYLSTIEIDGSTRIEKNEIKNNLENISLQIADVNRKISLQLPINIKDQKEVLLSINHKHASILISKIDQFEGINNINELYKTIKENQDWIDTYTHIVNYTNRINTILSESLIIKDVNENLYNDINNLVENINNLDICELDHLHQVIKIKYDEINSDESSNKIKKKIDEMQSIVFKNKLDHMSFNFINKSLEDSYSLVGKSNFKVLICLKKIEDQIKIFNILNQIKDCYLLFKNNLDANNQQLNAVIHKKEGIETINKRITDSISKLILEFYHNMPSSEITVLKDVLRIHNTNSQNAKVLALLLADKKMKRTIMPQLLCIYGNLNPVISRLVNDRIKPNIEILEQKLDNESIFYSRLKDILI